VIPGSERWIAGRYAGVTAGASDAGRWREAAVLRQQWRGWVVIWLAPIGRFRAYRRLPGHRRDTALTAAKASDLAALIGQAEQGTATFGTPPPDKEGS
jgi:hypothetical protein